MSENIGPISWRQKTVVQPATSSPPYQTIAHFKLKEKATFLRIDRLRIELPISTKVDPNSAAALQKLLGGKFGEMSTLNNYFFQNFNFQDKGKHKIGWCALWQRRRQPKG